MEMHIHNFTEWLTGYMLHKRLNDNGPPKHWSKPINWEDEAVYRHDLNTEIQLRATRVIKIC